MTLGKIQRTFIRETDRRPYRPRRYTMAGWTEIVRRQGNQCAICEKRRPLHAYYQGQIMVAGLCMSCTRLLAGNTEKQLRDRAETAYDQGDVFVALAEWHQQHPEHG